MMQPQLTAFGLALTSKPDGFRSLVDLGVQEVVELWITQSGGSAPVLQMDHFHINARTLEPASR